MEEQTRIVTASGAAALFPQAMKFLFDKTMPDGLTPVRYRVAYGGRGGAKSWSFARALLMMGTQRSQRVLCGREFQNSIKESVHKLLADQVEALQMQSVFEVQRDLIRAREDAPLLPEGVKNTSEFIFKGFHQNMTEVKSTEGIDVAWVEEAQATLKSSWDTLDPTVRKRGSEIWASFNPMLESDETYQRFVINTPADALVRKVSWRDNPWFDEGQMRLLLALRAKNYDDYLHVWEGECKLLLDGAVYADELRRAKAGGRICDVPYDANFSTDVIFDLGRADKTALWFRQQIAYETRFIDFYSSQLEEPEHYFDEIQKRRYNIGTIWLPHDAKAKRQGTKKTIQEQFQQVFGVKNVRIVPSLSVADGIAAARSGFARCYFDRKRCAEGLMALSHYCYEILEEGRKNPDGSITLSRSPKHDWASHASDAFRYEAIVRKLGQGIRIPRNAERLQELLDQAKADASSGLLLPGGRPPKRSGQSWMGR